MIVDVIVAELEGSHLQLGMDQIKAMQRYAVAQVNTRHLLVEQRNGDASELPLLRQGLEGQNVMDDVSCQTC